MKMIDPEKEFSEKTEELPQNGSSFFTRLLAAMLLLALFLQFHLSGSSIFGYNSREAVAAVSQSIDLQKVADSVRIKKHAPIETECRKNCENMKYRAIRMVL